jgi:nitroimidazol reductase NimA-like FMN-containing flavoprotein (pyridoxamine 5'-phosphate oxidase superfamily)
MARPGRLRVLVRDDRAFRRAAEPGRMTEAVSDEIEKLLTGPPEVGYLATSADGRPHVAPLWFRYEDGTVEVMTTGRKLANVRENPRVSLAVQSGDASDPDWTVTLLGTAEVVEDEAANRRANRRINARYGVEDDAWSGNTLVRIDLGSASVRTY